MVGVIYNINYKVDRIVTITVLPFSDVKFNVLVEINFLDKYVKTFRKSITLTRLKVHPIQI